MSLRNIFYKLTPEQRFIIRRAISYPLDIYDYITGKRLKYVPPRGMVFTGRGDYLKIANVFFSYFKEYCHLKPNARILDIGSGVGRMAVPFIGYLNAEGRYEGIDIVATGVNWCNKHIAAPHPQFNFTVADIYNDLYNAKGQFKAEEYIFPYPDANFDLILLTSVFTHMLEAEVAHYIEEISRMLKPGASCLATFFILNETSRHLMQQGGDRFNFPHHHGHYALMSEDTKTANVAFEQTWLDERLQAAGLKLEHFRPGYWCGRDKVSFPDFQDIVIVRKEY